MKIIFRFYSFGDWLRDFEIDMGTMPLPRIGETVCHKCYSGKVGNVIHYIGDENVTVIVDDMAP